MKLRQIQFVCAIARTRSFSQAAADCNATQPTLSNAVAQLESELEGKLFTRTTRQVDLTPFGRHMLPYLQAILTAQSEAVSAAQSFHNPQQKLLRIGISPLVDMRMITAVTEPFQRLHGPLEIFYKECLLDDLSDRIESGAIDLAVLPEHVVPDSLERQSFYADPLFYLPQHGTAQPSPLRLADIPTAPVILTGGGCGLNASLQALFDLDGAELPIYPGYAISYPVIQEWTWLGLGAGILPRAKISDSAAAASQLIHNSGQPAQFEFVWCWRREAREVAHIASFLDHLRHRGPKLVQGLDRPVAV